MRTLPNINDIAHNIVKIMGIKFLPKTDDISKNINLVKQYLIDEILELNDHDECFESDLESLVGGRNLHDKAYEILYKYIVEYKEYQEESIFNDNE